MAPSWGNLLGRSGAQRGAALKGPHSPPQASLPFLENLCEMAPSEGRHWLPQGICKSLEVIDHTLSTEILTTKICIQTYGWFETCCLLYFESPLFVSAGFSPFSQLPWWDEVFPVRLSHNFLCSITIRQLSIAQVLIMYCIIASISETKQLTETTSRRKIQFGGHKLLWQRQS